MEQSNVACVMESQSWMKPVACAARLAGLFLTRCTIVSPDTDQAAHWRLHGEMSCSESLPPPSRCRAAQQCPLQEFWQFLLFRVCAGTECTQCQSPKAAARITVQPPQFPIPAYGDALCVMWSHANLGSAPVRGAGGAKWSLVFSLGTI